jgi:hypothetical protein
MTHPRNCPLLIGYLSVVLKAAEKPENEDLRDPANELLEQVVETGTTEADTQLRGFRLVEELSRRVLPRSNYVRGTKRRVLGTALHTLGALERNEKAMQVFREGMKYSEEGIDKVLSAAEAEFELRELDDIAAGFLSSGNALSSVSHHHYGTLESVMNHFRKVADSVKKSLRGVPISWSVVGKEAATCLCAEMMLDHVLELAVVLSRTTESDARPPWNR